MFSRRHRDSGRLVAQTCPHTSSIIARKNHLHVQAAPDWPELQEAVAKLCLSWWQLDAPGKETLVLQTLPFMLVKALTTGLQTSSAYVLFPIFPGCILENKLHSGIVSRPCVSRVFKRKTVLDLRENMALDEHFLAQANCILPFLAVTSYIHERADLRGNETHALVTLSFL